MERFPAGLRRPLYALVKCKNNLKSWLFHTWLDLLFTLLVLAAMGALYMWSPVYRYENLVFPMRKDPFSGKWHAPMEISWPARPFIVSILIVSTIAPLVGAGVIIGMYLWAISTPARKLLDVHQLEAARRDPWNMSAALFGLFQGFAIVYVFPPLSSTLFRLQQDGPQSLETFRQFHAMANSRHRTFIQVIFKSFVGRTMSNSVPTSTS
jgi:hypothetical protein